MSATIICKEIRPSLEHVFFREFRGQKHLFMEMPSYPTAELGEISESWVEKISSEEVLARKKELRPDLYLDLIDSNGWFNRLTNPELQFNPFSLTDTRIKVFDTEANLRNTDWLVIYSHLVPEIRRLENTVTYQIFVNDNLVETIEFK